MPPAQRRAGEGQRNAALLIDDDAELLGQFAHQRGFGAFAGIDLATRKFPQVRHLLARRAPLQQHASLTIQHRRRHDRQQPLSPIADAMTARAYLRRLVRRLAPALRNARGATAVEYGLILALVVLVMIVALRGVAGVTVNMWTNVSDQVSKAG
ncbi:hypothetical protein WR25_02744 [Diploscapter pachys]|uniref:Uncharacterized protein n=4 Tax=cellular organisms TaxID=131567 RepID=A0A2A2K7P6_9BILA|nr:hypothetical protein WR25_02744 [Diploscapter pachys]